MRRGAGPKCVATCERKRKSQKKDDLSSIVGRNVAAGAIDTKANVCIPPVKKPVTKKNRKAQSIIRARRPCLDYSR